MNQPSRDKYALIKPSLDAHTLGVSFVAELLKNCGYDVLLADDFIERTLNEIHYEDNQKIIVKWIKENQITALGVSYRLDEGTAISMMGYLVKALKEARVFSFQGGSLKQISFSGLPKACEKIEHEHQGLVKTFKGGESPSETLIKLNVPRERIPQSIRESSQYDDLRLEFGKDLIQAHEYNHFKPLDRSNYEDYGTKKDTLLKRLQAPIKEFMPLMRAHVGPYSSEVRREQSVLEFAAWTKELARTGYLDILSIGSSQLTQSNFSEDWENKPNGGGVPINSKEEYQMIWEAGRPMLLRTYAGTKNIPSLAKIYEETIHIAWHALSLWWFNQLDERGPYDLYTNLKEHVKTIQYIASTNKPFEANVSHHFAFRGSDDVSYIVSAYLVAKLAKKLGIQTFILQNMLNTPRLTWGVQDLAKSRAMLRLVQSLEDSNFKVLLQPRAGLDYFKADIEEAKIQLAAVTAMMDDIDPHNAFSPAIIHVVSYSEAVSLATPAIINESIQITQQALKDYRKLRQQDKIEDMSKNLEVKERTAQLLASATAVIAAIEKHINNPYSPEGFYKIFAAGFLPVPYLWGSTEEFKHAKNWQTQPINGGIYLVDENKQIIPTNKMIASAKSHLQDADYQLKQWQLRQ